MTSQESCSSDVGSMPTASSDQETSQGVQSLKALSLNGLNQHLSHSASASEDSQSMPSGVKGRPHPVLSWGEVTEIPNGAAAKSHEYVKHPIAGSSSSSEPWQVRSTQNPSRPLVRRPTPMAIRVPKSVLDKASKKMMAASFEEDEEDEEERVVDGDQSPVPVSLKQGTTADVLVIEDIESSEADTPSPRISGSKDLHIGLAVDGRTNESSTDTGSPTIVVRTDVGEEISHEEAEKLADADEDESEEEEDDFNAEDKHFLSPTVSKSFTKNPEPEPSNTRVQTVPHHPRKFVRRQTPIKLDVPKNLKDIMAEKSSEGIMEEEEEEEEEKEERKPSECGQQKSEATSGQVDDNQSSTEKLSPSSAENAADASSGAVNEENTKNDVAEVDVSGRPDIITSVNCNNNNREASSLDLVEGANGTVKSNDGRNVQDGPKDMGLPTLQRQSLFKKSANSGNKDGSGSPSSARRKVSPHHTKILKRQLTPLEVDLPKHIISDAMKKTSDSFLEEEEEDES
ncbi:transcription initiation factor TFIID subunit 11-like [Lytechinus variegatus]|uniref:transcription initiation factor TFIID subunit 11-like n=1 Tax=Lytechinus variegatus TaxID=7654 RepID=UPI001BB20846|nr:transcription initiation factor TFIID subunit 11-like [Lytechinus variegatus]XP_041472227.1 transcription initiation factor TFIID subunit 11-like [Lytechinus variegatus]